MNEWVPGVPGYSQTPCTVYESVGPRAASPVKRGRSSQVVQARQFQLFVRIMNTQMRESPTTRRSIYAFLLTTKLFKPA
jgi:hypothetical protein